ncbi:MAG: hypothetical protein AAFR31_10830, partial [Cyanobacteria bacterium J06627_8]
AAVKDFSTAIQLASDAENFYYRAVAYWLQDDVERAVADLNRAIQQRPSTAKAYYLRYLINDHQQLSEDAHSDYRQAVQQEERSLSVWNDVYGCYARGVARLKEGETDKGLADLRFVDQQCKDINHTLLISAVVETLSEAELQ